MFGGHGGHDARVRNDGIDTVRKKIQMKDNLIGRFNNQEEQRVWIAAFESECSRNIPDKVAWRVADISVITYRERVIGQSIPIPE
jgi:hypothetical protein